MTMDTWWAHCWSLRGCCGRCWFWHNLSVSRAQPRGLASPAPPGSGERGLLCFALLRFAKFVGWLGCCWAGLGWCEAGQIEEISTNTPLLPHNLEVLETRWVRTRKSFLQTIDINLLILPFNTNHCHACQAWWPPSCKWKNIWNWKHRFWTICMNAKTFIILDMSV